MFGYVGSRINHILQYDVFLVRNIHTIKDFVYVFFYGAGYKIPIGYTFSLIGLMVTSISFNSKKIYLMALDKFSLLTTFVSIFGNIGCFFDGHNGCRGTPTSLFWGCRYSFTKNPSEIPLHPLQIYTSTLMLILFIWILFSSQKKAGNKFIISMTIVMSYNIMIDFLRERFLIISYLSLNQLIFIINCVLLVMLYYYLKTRAINTD